MWIGSSSSYSFMSAYVKKMINCSKLLGIVLDLNFTNKKEIWIH